MVCFTSRPDTNKETGKLQQRMEFESTDLDEFEYKINGSVSLNTLLLCCYNNNNFKLFDYGSLIKIYKVIIYIRSTCFCVKIGK